MAILMTELFLGIANRLAPNVQISFLGMALKSLIGIVFLALAWLLITQKLSLHMTDILNGFLKITKAL
jgi:type III secretory pathway component EscT